MVWNLVGIPKVQALNPLRVTLSNSKQTDKGSEKN